MCGQCTGEGESERRLGGGRSWCVDFANHNNESKFYFSVQLLAGVCRSDLYLVFLRFILDAGIIKSESRGTITRLLLRKHL